MKKTFIAVAAVAMLAGCNTKQNIEKATLIVNQMDSLFIVNMVDMDYIAKDYPTIFPKDIGNGVMLYSADDMNQATWANRGRIGGIDSFSVKSMITYNGNSIRLDSLLQEFTTFKGKIPDTKFDELQNQYLSTVAYTVDQSVNGNTVK
jgi:hypothetical protein